MSRLIRNYPIGAGTGILGGITDYTRFTGGNATLNTNINAVDLYRLGGSSSWFTSGVNFTLGVFFKVESSSGEQTLFRTNGDETWFKINAGTNQYSWKFNAFSRTGLTIPLFTLNNWYYAQFSASRNSSTISMQSLIYDVGGDDWILRSVINQNGNSVSLSSNTPTSLILGGTSDISMAYFAWSPFGQYSYFNITDAGTPRVFNPSLLVSSSVIDYVAALDNNNASIANIKAPSPIGTLSGSRTIYSI